MGPSDSDHASLDTQYFFSESDCVRWVGSPAADLVLTQRTGLALCQATKLRHQRTGDTR